MIEIGIFDMMLHFLDLRGKGTLQLAWNIDAAMLRCVAQSHTGNTGNEHLSPAKRYGKVRNKTQFAFSVAKSFCCRDISWFKITERGDPCHAGPGLLCSGSATLYLAIVAVHPKYPKFSTMGETW